MSITTEENRIKRSFEHIEDIEEVAGTFERSDGRRAKLLSVVGEILAEIGPVRPRIAASLLELSEPTVRTWAREGVLIAAEQETQRVLLDPHRIHEVMHLVGLLRSAGQNRKLLDAVWHRLSDQALLEREDLNESMAQMQVGEGRVLSSEELERRSLS